MDFLDYLGGQLGGAGAGPGTGGLPVGAGGITAPAAAPSTGGFGQNFIAALGRSRAAGGGLSGLGAALTPSAGNAPTTAGGTPGAMNWNTPANNGKLSF